MTDILLKRIVTQGLQSEPFTYYVLASCEGDQALATFIDDGVGPRRSEVITADAGAPLRRAYIRSVKVRGFRGIGPERTLDLHPANGLTVITGRNGSGKSSFAEAIEVILTGKCVRVASMQKRWRNSWRNLDATHAPWIALEFNIEHAGSVVLQRKWNAQEDLEDTTGEQTVVKAPDGTVPIAETGWRRAAADYRPFLAYSELGTLITESPSQLHDALLAGLGLSDIENARKRIVAARNQRKTLITQARDTAKLLLATARTVASQHEDERLRRLAALLDADSVDLDAITALVDLAADTDDDVQQLRELASLPALDLDIVSRAVHALREADERDRFAAADKAGQARRVARLLEQSLEVVAASADGTCPVCKSPGVITDAWRVETRAEIDRLKVEAEAAELARGAVRQRLAEARQLITPMPGAVTRAAASPVDGIDASAVAAAWAAWAAVPADITCETLASHLEARGPALADAVERVREAARALHERRQDVWRPLALQVQAWLPDARRAQRLAVVIPQLDEAADWLRTAVDELRDERFEPIQAQAVKNWELVRLQSSVNLRDITPSGAGPTRSVSLDVDIDGHPSNALGVMSQGEINSMALSLFLPRAALAESPFGFIVVDDPVQALDPSKVDGLARLLAGAAQERQVIVLSHDDRLPEAIRRLGIEARFVDVSRRANSVVELRRTSGPIELLIEDARAVAKTPEVPLSRRQRLVAGFCRSAIEAGCMQAIRARRIGRGEAHADVEDFLKEIDRLKELVSVALFDRIDEAKVGPRLTNALGAWARDVLDDCNEGAHGRFDGDPLALVKDAEKLALYLRDHVKAA
ncbi:hypothetical protein TBR22_A51800 [Luteitalea sp. TBR-22]|uniref:AAA family ATPase n=1 Tax=Luteitalea sp. TBR-22 TaxID=2802971 RepID=UPI001AF87073|nr:AAA family ATPase [Luteitalea sp. TBR-22]BCS35945.1 hypothetical protein TBR22_A51800 [Luteitalea sp. TBR-22]